VTRYTTEIIARDMQFLDSKGSSNASSTQQENPEMNDQSGADVPDSAIDDDDIPF